MSSGRGGPAASRARGPQQLDELEVGEQRQERLGLLRLERQFRLLVQLHQQPDDRRQLGDGAQGRLELCQLLGVGGLELAESRR